MNSCGLQYPSWRIPAYLPPHSTTHPFLTFNIQCPKLIRERKLVLVYVLNKKQSLLNTASPVVNYETLTHHSWQKIQRLLTASCSSSCWQHDFGMLMESSGPEVLSKVSSSSISFSSFTNTGGSTPYLKSS